MLARSLAGWPNGPDRSPLAFKQFGVIRELREEGKIRFVGVSEVTAGELHRARELIDIATVQNRFNLADQTAGDVLSACEADGIGFLPWAPMAMGDLARSSGALAVDAALIELSDDDLLALDHDTPRPS